MAECMKYRSRTDIVYQILEAAQGGTTKTKIMYQAYLSYAQLKEYLTVLIDAGLLEYKSERQTYNTSPKGVQFLQTYNRIGEIIAPDMTSKK